MNKRMIVASLSKIANDLDALGKFEEANEVTQIMVRLSDIGGGRGTSNDSANYKGLMSLIVQQLESGNIPAATDTYLRGLKTLQSDDSKSKFSKQWERVIAKYRDKPTQKPTQKPSNVPGGLFPPSQNPNIPIGVDPNLIPGGGGALPFEPPMDNVPGGPKSVKPATGGQTGPESDKQLNRWVNKAENIYKAWSTKPAASRNDNDAVGLIADIDLYLQEMQFRVPSGSPMHSLINSKRTIVQKMMRDIRSGTPMGSGYTPTPYSKVTGYPAKDASPFAVNKRLTGPKLQFQADKEVKGI